MKFFMKVAWSTIGKKILMAITGLALCGFIVGHLVGNFTLLLDNPDIFNLYAHKLSQLGIMLALIEIGLAGIFLLHIISGVTVTLENWRARPQKYQVVNNAGGSSKKTLSSRTMIYTGLVIAIFLISHVAMFKYGAAGQAMNLEAEYGHVKDLHALVIGVFQNIGFVIGYVAVMALLGFHLRHGFWSAFQSLGLNHPRYMRVIQAVGVLFAVIMAFSFLFIPIFLFIKY